MNGDDVAIWVLLSVCREHVESEGEHVESEGEQSAE